MRVGGVIVGEVNSRILLLRNMQELTPPPPVYFKWALSIGGAKALRNWGQCA